MNPALPATAPVETADSRSSAIAPSLVVYALFAGIVFAVQGPQPPLGPDHLSYLQLADSILAACPAGDFWRETNSIRFYGVLLAYLHGWTGSHVVSMKVMLAVFTVLFLLTAELFFRLFAANRRQAMLFALMSGFAVSFGFASWGVTDSTALLPRTLVAPIVMIAMWLWFGFDGRVVRYLALPLLLLGSVMHLSTFYALGVLVLVELWDFFFLRRMHIDRRVPAFLGALVLSVLTLFGLEQTGVANKSLSVYVPDMLRSVGFEVENLEIVAAGGFEDCRAARGLPASTMAVPRPSIRPGIRGVSVVAPPPAEPDRLSARDAWAAELSMRPWRNMPMPLANIANGLSSSLFIVLLALAGMVAAHRAGFTRTDHLMAAMFVAVPVFAFLPQTIVWVLRSFTDIYPITIEEVRAVGLIMIPALYFILRLFRRVLESRRPGAVLECGAIVVAVLALPLFMKNLPQVAREGILSVMTSLHVVDPANESRVANARAALGISPGASALYYSTEQVRQWLASNTPSQARILTDRDDLVLLLDKVILGPRQVAVHSYKGTKGQASLFLRTTQAMAARDVPHLREIAAEYGADFAVVAWRSNMAIYADDAFSVIPLRPTGTRPR